MVALANYVAFSIRYDGSIPDAARQIFLIGLPFVLLVRGITFYKLRLFGGVWRYAGTWDLRNLVIAAVVSSAGLAVALPLVIAGYPRSILLMDGVLSVFLLGGLRLAVRTSRERSPRLGARRVLIFGAGDAGAMVAREMRENAAHQMVAIGFVDDNPGKVGAYIHGVPVYGTRRDLRRLIERLRPDEILIAVPRLSSESLRQLLLEMDGLEPPLRILPTFAHMIDRRRNLLDAARPMAIEDLLPRTPAKLDTAPIVQLLRGKRVLVTGAGGSIGSELCRQVGAFSPATLVMVDRYENGLFEIDQSLSVSAPHLARFSVIADITDRRLMERVFALHQPEIVLHAAAHKHVPLMEANSPEAVKNNVAGTRILVEVSVAAGVERFVLVSTDKAVNPSSVMGATKRVAELIVQSVPPECESIFAAVRFGNVLGSNGSVVPLFLRQIAQGGPVTVTHPEMRRFFMLIPEAVQLLLHAAARAKRGDIYALEMGEQVNVTEMARALIKLTAPQRPEKDIPIRYIGIRPGEKLYEELVAEDETIERGQDGLDPICLIRARHDPLVGEVAQRVAQLEAAAADGDHLRIAEILRELVPTFRPTSEEAEAGDSIQVAASTESESERPARSDRTREPVLRAAKAG